jgi:hypothetical protein
MPRRAPDKVGLDAIGLSGELLPQLLLEFLHMEHAVRVVTELPQPVGDGGLHGLVLGVEVLKVVAREGALGLLLLHLHQLAGQLVQLWGWGKIRAVSGCWPWPKLRILGVYT